MADTNKCPPLLCHCVSGHIGAHWTREIYTSGPSEDLPHGVFGQSGRRVETGDRRIGAEKRWNVRAAGFPRFSGRCLYIRGYTMSTVWRLE